MLAGPTDSAESSPSGPNDRQNTTVPTSFSPQSGRPSNAFQFPETTGLVIARASAPRPGPCVKGWVTGEPKRLPSEKCGTQQAGSTGCRGRLANVPSLALTMGRQSLVRDRAVRPKDPACSSGRCSGHPKKSARRVQARSSPHGATECTGALASATPRPLPMIRWELALKMNRTPSEAQSSAGHEFKAKPSCFANLL